MTNEQLVVLIQDGIDEVENMRILWQQNEGFIGKLALIYSGQAEMDDLKQEGYLALCEAVRGYDATKEVPFLSYASFWIKTRMRRYADQNQPVRLPSYLGDEVRQYQKTKSDFLKRYGYEASDRELCGLLGVNEEKIRKLKRAASMGQIQSLNELLPGTEDFTLEESIASEEDLEEEAAARLDRERMKEELWRSVDELPDRLPVVVRMRYQDENTLNEVGKRLGVSLSRAAQMNKQAMRTLRQRVHRYQYKQYYDQYLAAAPIRHVGLESFKRTWYSAVEREVLGWR